jgi:hypothetical protein
VDPAVGIIVAVTIVAAARSVVDLGLRADVSLSIDVGVTMSLSLSSEWFHHLG